MVTVNRIGVLMLKHQPLKGLSENGRLSVAGLTPKAAWMDLERFSVQTKEEGFRA